MLIYMFRVHDKMSNEFEKHYNEYGWLSISKIFICREPIMKGVEWFINAVSFGKYERAKKDMGYDQIFHLYFMILLNNGMWILLEKNQQPVLKPSDISKLNSSQHMGVFIPNTITLKDFIDNSIKTMGSNEFFIYDGLSSNCQKFVTDVLISNHLWATKYDLFVNQSINESLKDVSGLKTVMRKITDLGAITNQILGKGQHFKRQNGDHLL